MEIEERKKEFVELLEKLVIRNDLINSNQMKDFLQLDVNVL
jgi:hypothetical protein